MTTQVRSCPKCFQLMWLTENDYELLDEATIRAKCPHCGSTVRFTLRKPKSISSAVNLARIADLTGQGLMQPAGLRAFAARAESRTAVYAFEQANIGFDSTQTERFQANGAAWQQFQIKTPWFRRRVISAKQPATRERRLTELIAEFAGQTSE